MLDSHSAVSIPPETHLVRGLLRQTRRYIRDGVITDTARFREALLDNAYMKPLHPFVSDAQLDDKKQLGEYLSFLFNQYAEQNGATVWGEKTPHHLWYWQELRKIFPNSRFIVMVRDGRDVACSLTKVNWASNSALVNAARWKLEWHKCDRMARELGADSVLRVHYEDLVQDTPTVLQNVCTFLNLDYEPHMLEAFRSNSSVVHAGETWKNRNSENLFTSSIGRYAKDLPANTVLRLNDLLRNELTTESPYQVEKATAALPVRAAWYLTAMGGFAFELAMKAAIRQTNINH